MSSKAKSCRVWSCRVCGCTDDRACPGGCHWVGPDLCSQCELLPVPADVVPPVEAWRAALETPARYEVRVLDDERIAHLVVFIRDQPRCVVRLTSDQAHELSVLLVQAAERIAGEPHNAVTQGVEGDLSVLPVPAHAVQRENERAEILKGCERASLIAGVMGASLQNRRIAYTDNDAEFIALFAAAVREHLQGGA